MLSRIFRDFIALTFVQPLIFYFSEPWAWLAAGLATQWPTVVHTPLASMADVIIALQRPRAELRRHPLFRPHIRWSDGKRIQILYQTLYTFKLVLLSYALYGFVIRNSFVGTVVLLSYINWLYLFVSVIVVFGSRSLFFSFLYPSQRFIAIISRFISSP